jgi:hypothetical protein
VDIDISVQSGSLRGSTTMWLVFKNPVKEGDTFRVHSRYHVINDILINGKQAAYCRKDGLRNLNADSSGKRKTLFLGEEMDLLNRAALEIARQGELEIVVPNLSNMKTEGLKPIPKNSPKEVLRRFDKLSYAYNSLSSIRDYGSEASTTGAHQWDDDNVSLSTEAQQTTTKFIQLQIHFVIGAGEINTFGIVFRRQPSFAQDLYNYLTGKGAKVTDSTSSSSTASKDSKSIKAVYTTNNQGGSLYDVDGVRCWLPCLDSMDQRAIFDINISVSRTFHVTCSGKKLAAVRNAQRPKAGRLIHRFFTVQRIPAMQVGFFVGKIESYRMPMYQAKARVWVLKGIQDVIIRNDRIGEEHHIDHNGTERAVSSASKNPPLQEEKLKRALESYVSRDLRAAGTTTNGNSTESASDSASKRRRLDTDGQFATSRSQKDSFVPPEGSMSSNQLQLSLDSRRLAAEEDRRLYFDAVHHTMLAFDIAVRLIHKFTGHRLSNDELAIIFVHDLGQDFMSFEGVILVDMKFLHDIRQVYKETPAHLILIEAYLYSWLKSTIPLAWYNLEFIVHGLVGYLKFFYKEEMDGEEEGQCYLHRLKANVAALEKAGFGESMVHLHPENNYIFSRHYGEYMRARSTLLFLMLESKIGGKDPMRLALKELIKSPLIFHETTVKSVPRQFASNTSDQSPMASSINNLSPTHKSGRDFHTRLGNESVYSAGSLSPTTGYHAQHSIGGETPYQFNMGLNSPYHVTGGITPGHPTVATGDIPAYVSNDRYSRNRYMHGGALSPRSPYRPAGGDALGSRSPYSTGGALSPMSISEGYGSMSPPQLTRQGSLTSYTSWEQLAAEILQSECISAENFVQLFQYVSDTFEDFGDDFLDRFVQKQGFGLYNVKVRCDDGKKITVRTEQVGYDRIGNISKRFSRPDTMTIIMVEECDDFVSKFNITVGDVPHTYEKAVYTRPGRRKERGLNAKERSLRSALDIVRTSEAYTVKYAVIDPTETFFADIFFACNDMQLIEMLFGDYNELGPQLGKYSTLIRAQALQSIIRSDASSDPRLRLGQIIDAPDFNADAETNAQNMSISRLADKSAEVEVLAMQEVAMNTSRDGKELDFPLPLRIEAIYGLATWQNTHAPEMIAEEDGKQNAWPAMEALVECLFELFTDVDTNEIVPIHLHDDNECSLRYAMLLALSMIRCKRGYTPPEATEVLLLFAEYLSEDYQQRMKDQETARREAKQAQRQTKLLSSRGPKGRKETTNANEANNDEEGDDDSEANDEDNNEDNPFEVHAAEPEYDDAQYRAVLFIALSRIRFSTFYLNNMNHPVYRIIHLAKSTIQRSFGDAKVDARIAFDRILLHHEDMHLVSGTPQGLPKLKDDGLEVAAAMTCLSEMDIQATLAFPRERATPTERLKACDILPQSARVRPHPFGLLSSFNFMRCVVPPNRKIVCTDLKMENDEPVSFATGPVPAAQRDAASSSWSMMEPAAKQFMQHYDYFLCSPLVRATAYECFARNCVAMHIACQERSRYTNVKPKDPLFFSAAILEVLDAVQTSESSMFVRQEAAWTFQNLMLERPTRVVLSALSQGVHLNAFAVQDAKALSMAPQHDFTLDPVYQKKEIVVIRPVDAVTIGPGDAINVTLSTWQRLIARSMGFQQNIRNVLLRSWLAAFGGERPPPAWQEKFQVQMQQDAASMSGVVGNMTPLLRSLYEVYDSVTRDPKRLVVRVPRFLDMAQTLGTRHVPNMDADDHSQVNSNRGGRGRGRTSYSNHPASAVTAPVSTAPTSHYASPSAAGTSGGGGGLKLTLGSKYE